MSETDRATVTLLPDTVRVPLDAAGLGGAVAIVAPLDLVAGASWLDAVAGDAEPNVRALMLVRRHVQTIEGLSMERADGSLTPYDHREARHFASLPREVVHLVYAVLTAAA